MACVATFPRSVRFTRSALKVAGPGTDPVLVDSTPYFELAALDVATLRSVLSASTTQAPRVSEERPA